MKKIISAIMALAMTAAVSSAAYASRYSDTQGHWAEEIIDSYSTRGIIKGSDGTFRPDDSITRGEFCVILDRLLDYENKVENRFSDLDDNFYTDAVLKANAAGVIGGYEDKIRPKDNITREEAAVMLCRAYDIDTAVWMTYETNTVSAWAVDAMYALMTDGILSGSSLDELRAGDNITRAEALKVINGIEEKTGAAEETELPSAMPEETEVPTVAPTQEAAEAPVEDIVTEEPIEDIPEELPEEESDYNDGEDEAPAENTAVVYIEAARVGVELIAEPMEIEVNEGDTAAAVVDAALNMMGYTYSASGDLTDGFYLSAISGLDSFDFFLAEDIKEYLEERNISYNETANIPGTLGEFDFTDRSGWIYFVNDEKADVGMSEYIVNPGDVITLRFTLDYGDDL